MIKKSKLLLSIILLITIMFGFNSTLEASLEPELDHIHYQISSDGSQIRNLELNSGFNIDHINSLDLGLIFVADYNRINLRGIWNVDFLQYDEYDLGLDLVLATNFNGSGRSLGTGVGFGMESEAMADSDLFVRGNYFIGEEDNNWVLEGGLTLPLIYDSKLTISAGNDYWQRSEVMIKLGVIMEY